VKSAKQSSLRIVVRANRNSTLAGMIRLRKGAPFTSPTVIVCRISFDGLGCGESPISVWLGTRGARMQFANFPDRRTTVAGQFFHE
jgi:hypothetical protein